MFNSSYSRLSFSRHLLRETRPQKNACPLRTLAAHSPKKDPLHHLSAYSSTHQKKKRERRIYWNVEEIIVAFSSAIMDDLDVVNFEDAMVDFENSLYYDDFDPNFEEMYSEPDRLSTFFYNFKSCVVPTTVQTAETVGPLLLMCLVLRVVSVLRLPTLLLHFVSLVAGVAALVMFTNTSAIYPITMCVLAYPVLFIRSGNKGRVMAVGCVVFLLTW